MGLRNIIKMILRYLASFTVRIFSEESDGTDSYEDAAPESWKQGHKSFTGTGELVWNLECYAAFCMVQKGYTPLEAGFGGRTELPYYMYIADGAFKLYGAKEIMMRLT